VLDAIVRCAPRHWAVIWISASAAAIRPSHSTHAAIGTAQVSGQRARKWLAARSPNYCPSHTSRRLHTAARTVRPVLQNKRLLYDLLYRTSAATMLELARDPKHLGADIGFLGVLHTWDRTRASSSRPLHSSRGGLALDGSRWIDSSCRFFLPVHALSRVFRGKFSEQLRELFQQEKLQFHGSLEQLATPGAFATSSGNCSARTGRLRQATLRRCRTCSQLPGRYTIALPSPTIVSWRLKMIAFLPLERLSHGGKKKVMTISADEFLRRFLLHVLPGAWFASATSDSSPTADAALRSTAAALCSVWRNASIRQRHQPPLSILLRHHAGRRTAHTQPVVFPSRPDQPTQGGVPMTVHESLSAALYLSSPHAVVHQHATPMCARPSKTTVTTQVWRYHTCHI